MRSFELQHDPAGREVPFTIYAPSVINPELPFIFLFNGFSVESAQYSEVGPAAGAVRACGLVRAAVHGRIAHHHHKSRPGQGRTSSLIAYSASAPRPI